LKLGFKKLFRRVLKTCRHLMLSPSCDASHHLAPKNFWKFSENSTKNAILFGKVAKLSTPQNWKKNKNKKKHLQKCFKKSHWFTHVNNPKGRD